MVHNQSFPALSSDNADRLKQHSRHSSIVNARCSPAAVRTTTMTRNADDVTLDPWRKPQRAPTGGKPPPPPARTSLPRSHALPIAPDAPAHPLLGSVRRGSSEHSQRPVTRPLPVPVPPPPTSSAPPQAFDLRQRGWYFHISPEGKLAFLCNESLTPWVSSFYDARLLRSIRHQSATAIQALAAAQPPQEDEPDPLVVFEIPDHVGALTSTDISRDSSVSPSASQWRPSRLGSVHPAHSLKRRRSAVTPQSQSGDARQSLLQPMDVEEDQLASDVTASNEAEVPPPPPSTRTSFRLDEEDKAIRFLGARFGDLQQATCKIILKDWIKRVEPKKQSKYPYSASNRDKQVPRNSKASPTGAPPWWPPGLRHKEPDHIDKEERRQLFLHLLQLCKDPDFKELLDPNVREEVRRFGWVTILEDSTKDKTLRIDREKDEGMRFERRKKILQDIYHCARSLEEVWAGEIDADTRVTYEDPSPLSRGRYPRRNHGSRPVPSKASKAHLENKSKNTGEVSEDASDEKDDDSEWEFLPKEAQAVTNSKDQPTLTSYSVSTNIPHLTEATHTSHIAMQRNLEGDNVSLRRQSLGDLPAARSALTSSNDREKNVAFLSMGRTASSMTTKSSVSDQAKHDTTLGRRHRQLHASTANIALTHGSMHSPIKFQHQDLASPTLAQNQPSTQHRVDSNVGSDSDNFALHSARARQQSRPFTTTSATNGQPPFIHQNVTGNPVDQLPMCSPTHTEFSDTKTQSIEIPTSEAPYEMKPIPMGIQDSESEEAMRYRIYSSDPHVFDFQSGPDHYHNEISEGNLMTRDLANDQSLHTGQQYESDAEYAQPMYDTQRSMDCGPATTSNFPTPMSGPEYPYRTPAFAQPLPIPYAAPAAVTHFQAQANTFSGRNEYSSFQSSPDVASPPNSLYTTTPTSGTMAQSPASATSSYPHPLAMSRPVSTIPQYQDSAGGSAFSISSQVPMRKTSSAMPMSPAGVPPNFNSGVHGLAVGKGMSTLPQDATDGAFQNSFMAPPYMDDAYDSGRGFNM